MHKFLVGTVTSVVALLFVALPSVSAQSAQVAVDELAEIGLYDSDSSLDEAETEQALESITQLEASNVKAGIVLAAEVEPNDEAFVDDVFAETSLSILVLIQNEEFLAFASSDPATLAASDIDIESNLVCATAATSVAPSAIQAIVLFTDALTAGCAPEDETAPVETESGKDRFGAEDLGFVINEVADDEVYIGETRTDIDEQSLIEAVREVNTFGGLRLIVIAPDNPQPSASAFARRLQEQTKAEVLLFVEGDRAVSSVNEDATQPRSSEVNSRKRNQACATTAVWSQANEAQAVTEFGNRLANGCPFEPPLILVLVILAVVALVGLLALVVLKENEAKTLAINAELPPPEPEDLIVESPVRSSLDS